MDTKDGTFNRVHSAIETADKSADKWLMSNVFTREYIYETVYLVIKSVEESARKGDMSDGLWYYLEAYINNEGQLRIDFGNQVSRRSRIEYNKNRAVIFWDYQGYRNATKNTLIENSCKPFSFGGLIHEIDVSKQAEDATQVICGAWEIEL